MGAWRISSSAATAAAATATLVDLLVPLGGAGVGHVLQLRENMVGEHS